MAHALALEVGMQVGAYRVVGMLGRGAMGGVAEVEDKDGRRYALKSPIMDVNATGDVTRRFAREANALRMLDHPNLVAAVDVFVAGGQLFLVMEKLEGRTLTKALEAEKQMAPPRALAVVRGILAGVEHAHVHNVVHRDLKPDNILLVPMQGGWEHVKIIDFGILKLIGDAEAAYGAAALTRTGIVVGTPQYMAPEQALGRPLDQRTDLYSIGIILYELLTGRPPFKDPDPLTVMRLHVKQEPPPLRKVTNNAVWCTPQMVALVESALAKDPNHRLPNATAMIALLDDAWRSIER